MKKRQATPQIGQRHTRQRDAIFRVVEQAEGPLPVPEIHRIAQEKLPDMGIATVYRTIKLMMEAGEVQQVNMPSGEVRYESAHLGHHDHFRCRHCEQVFDLEKCPLHLKVGETLPGGFIVEDHEMTLFGLCAECAKLIG